MTKSEIRKQMRAARPDAATLQALSKTIVVRIQSAPWFQSIQTLGLYMPLADEIDISPLIASGDKQIFIPAFDPAIELYRMAEYVEPLKTGPFGIPEPENPRLATETEIDLILVPGVAFDRSGNRVGRGGGFYDRLLPLYQATRMGICFDFQCHDRVPTEAHDLQLHGLITETELIEY